MLRGFRPNTQRSYMSKWLFFLHDCRAHGRAPLPAAPYTVVGYIFWEQERRALKPPSLPKDLSAVASGHTIAGYEDPTKHDLVRIFLYGYRVRALEEAGGELALQRIPLRASCILRGVNLGISAADAHLRVQCAGMVLGYLVLNRPGAAACVRWCDIAFTAHGLELQQVDFKLALRTGRERHAFTVPVNRAPGVVDKLVELVRLVWRQHCDAGRAPKALFFSDPALPAQVRLFHLEARTTNVWLRRVLGILRIAVPLGGVYQGHAVRAVAATRRTPSAFPSLPSPEMLGHRSLHTTLRCYVGTRWRVTPAAGEVLGMYFPRYLRL